MKKIFLLEDSKIVTELLKFDLTRELNCEVIEFQNGNDLIANIDSAPDIIILDHFIENEFNENGLSVLKRIKIADKSIPVIIFSGQHNLHLAVELIHAGAIDYIDKNKESFLEDINYAVRNIFKYEDTVLQLSKVEKRITSDKKQIFGIGIFCLLLLTILFIVQKNHFSSIFQ